jgi:hypothetical protein
VWLWCYRATGKVPTTLMREGYTAQELLDTAATAYLLAGIEKEEIDKVGRK